MNTVTNYYDELDLKYPEIAIAMDDIDRLDPQPTRFIIPILTPNMNNSDISEQIIHQNKGNLQNSDTVLEINNINVTNYITLPVPKEVCGGLETELYKLASFVNKANLSGSGGDFAYYSFSSSKTSIFDFITDDIRYIKKGSKWLVVFVGGDITNPRIIARYE